MPAEVASGWAPPEVGAMTRTMAWLVLSALALGSAGGAAAEGKPRVRIGKVHRLRVTHTTRVTVEAGTARLQVWQAKPRARTWPGLAEPFSATDVVFTPKGAEEIATRAEDGVAWKWDVRGPTPGAIDFVATYDLPSADRDLDTASLTIRWKDVEADAAEAMKGQPALPTPTPKLLELHRDLRKKSKDVVGTIEAFAQWIRAHITHRGNVPYRTDDLDAILAGGAGHCGHRATVFLALCQASGLAARKVVGHSLDNATGLLDGHDDPNRHVWAEVHLPGLGWIEVEPSPTGSPFAIPFTRVANPADLQSCFVEAVTAQGQSRRPAYEDTLRRVEPAK